MRAVWIFSIVMLSWGALLQIASPAGAGSSATGCDVLDTLQADLSAIGEVTAGSSTPTVKQLEETYRRQAEAYHRAAKNAPKKLRAALESLGDNYEAVQDDVNGTDSTAGADAVKFFTSKKYTKALSKYRKYRLNKCPPP